MSRLGEVSAAIRASWSAETCDPCDLADWHEGNASRGQCGVSALVLHDLVGGELLCAEVTVAGERVGYHYWNRLPDGSDLDLTREQFGPHEVVGEPDVVARVRGLPPRRAPETYELLRSRVDELLAATAVS